MHVHQFKDIEGLRTVGYFWVLDWKLWLEILIVAIHNPPGYEASFALGDMGSQNIYVMRSEVNVCFGTDCACRIFCTTTSMIEQRHMHFKPFRSQARVSLHTDTDGLLQYVAAVLDLAHASRLDGGRPTEAVHIGWVSAHQHRLYVCNQTHAQ